MSWLPMRQCSCRIIWSPPPPHTPTPPHPPTPPHLHKVGQLIDNAALRHFAATAQRENGRAGPHPACGCQQQPADLLSWASKPSCKAEVGHWMFSGTRLKVQGFLHHEGFPLVLMGDGIGSTSSARRFGRFAHVEVFKTTCREELVN